MTTPAPVLRSDAPVALRFAVPPFAGPSRAMAAPFAAAPHAEDSGVAHGLIAPFVPAALRVARATAASSTLEIVTVAAAVATPSDSVPALFRDDADEYPLPSIREFVSGEADVEPIVSVPSAADAGALPWIDQFLATTPAVPMMAISGPPDAYRYTTPAESTAAVHDVETETVEALVMDAEREAVSPETTVSAETLAEAVVNAAPTPADVEAIAVLENESPAVAEPHTATPTPLYNTPLYNTPLYNTPQYNTPLRSTPLYNTPLYSTPLRSTPISTVSMEDAAPLSEVAATHDGEHAPSASSTADDSVSAMFAESVDDSIDDSGDAVAMDSAVTARVVPPYVPRLGTPADAASASDEWPLAEAAESLDEITRAIANGDLGAHEVTARLFGSIATPVSLPAWSDDDLMNIMPTRAATPAHATPATSTPLFATPVSHEHASPDQRAADASALAAAQALELLAQRVRAGELQLPGYDPQMGDAAALVSALAALLGLRLG